LCLVKESVLSFTNTKRQKAMSIESKSMNDTLQKLLLGFQPITLKELDAVSLQKRKDTKFVFHLNQLPELLEKLQPYFKILEIEDNRMHQYDTSYFDTLDYSMYHDHHNERLNRYKIRIRNYKITNASFLEIKFKNVKRTTIKKRTPIDSKIGNINSLSSGFIEKHSPYNPENLKLALNNSFYRMTFADLEMTQRLTIDTGLFFSDSGNSKSLENIVIAELKQSTLQFSAQVFFILKKMKIHPYRISKYCIGQALLKKEVKHNRFKPHLHVIEKMCNNSTT
jgi:hypothetical protein